MITQWPSRCGGLVGLCYVLGEGTWTVSLIAKMVRRRCLLDLRVDRGCPKFCQSSRIWHIQRICDGYFEVTRRAKALDVQL
jgi:hypothetical protein